MDACRSRSRGVGETIAVVNHQARALDLTDIADAIGAAARLAVDNERLRVQAPAKLSALRESRARVVQAATCDDGALRVEGTFTPGTRTA